jgi:hypothetical protein
MLRKALLAAGFLTLTACFKKLDTTGVGDFDTMPLSKVDSIALPANIKDATGTTYQFTSGQLAVYSTRSTCDYTITLSSGQSFTGTRSCDTSLGGGAIEQIPNGLRLTLNLATTGAPTGNHDFDFVAVLHPCMCPKFCLCTASRSVPDSLRRLAKPVDDSLRIQRYRAGLLKR